MLVWNQTLCQLWNTNYNTYWVKFTQSKIPLASINLWPGKTTRRSEPRCSCFSNLPMRKKNKSNCSRSGATTYALNHMSPAWRSVQAHLQLMKIQEFTQHNQLSGYLVTCREVSLTQKSSCRSDSRSHTTVRDAVCLQGLYFTLKSEKSKPQINVI